MNYYNPNFYQNYPYGNSLLFNQSQVQPQLLNGKIVDTVDVVKAADVPLGSFGVFPKADLNEVYIKSWNQNGTTNIITYQPVSPEPIQQNNQNNLQYDNNLLIEKINALELKIDAFLKTQKETKSNVTTTENNTKKEIKISDY